MLVLRQAGPIGPAFVCAAVLTGGIYDTIVPLTSHFLFTPLPMTGAILRGLRKMFTRGTPETFEGGLSPAVCLLALKDDAFWCSMFNCYLSEFHILPGDSSTKPGFHKTSLISRTQC